jgi:hypothetical protein
MAQCGARFRKPVSALRSDRALRYRANTPECRPKGRKICEFCGSDENVEVHHRDGKEENSNPKNLSWACRSCNTTIGAEMARRGVGRRVSQTNPAKTMGQWVAAVLSAKGESSEIPRAEAIEIVHSTPASDRSKFARQIWQRRRKGRGRRNPGELLIFGNPGKVRVQVQQDSVTGKFTASFHDSEFGDTYATAATKSAAVKDLRARIHRMRAAVTRSKNPAGFYIYSKLRDGGGFTPQQGPYATKPQARRAGKTLFSDPKFVGVFVTSKKSNPARRRNPSDETQAVKLFESFHGKDAIEIIDAQRSAAIRLDYTALGPLIALGFDAGNFSDAQLPKKWDECSHIAFEGDGVMLASAPNGRQLYFIDGNQNLDSSLSMFEGVDTQKDLIDLGDVEFVVYEARKIHDNFEPADYCHRFGETGKTLPRLAYDKLKKEMLLIGGEYFISTKAGISPGIEG